MIFKDSFSVTLFTFTMPKRSKKVDTGKKKGTVSKAKSSNSTTQPPNLDLNGSFITPSGGTIVSTASPLQPPLTSDQVTGNDTVLAYLQRIDATNQALLKRVDVLESQRVATATVQAANVNLGQDLTSRPVSSTNTHLTGVRPVPSASFTTTQAGPSQSAATNTGLFSQHNQSVPPSALHDAVMPDLNNIRANPTISQSVSQIMATLEAGSRAEATQGKGTIRKSGRFNATDAITAVPELRWPNEGYHGTNGRKRTLYDDLTVQEWAVGQLSNIYQIQDPVLVKQVLLQVILSLRDATSLPWQAVRGAWGTSMHEIEQGSLQWADATQWALNRLSTSQIAMANASQVTGQPTAQKKVCKFYNEGTCSHEGNHGQFKHVCGFCARQGKNYTHPELKCQIKIRGGDRTQAFNK